MTLSNLVDEFVCLRFGQAAGDFVEQQQFRLRGQRTRQFEALAVQQRQRAGQLVGTRFETGAVEHIDADVVRGMLGQFTAEGRADQQVLEHRHAAERAAAPDTSGRSPPRNGDAAASWFTSAPSNSTLP